MTPVLLLLLQAALSCLQLGCADLLRGSELLLGDILARGRDFLASLAVFLSGLACVLALLPEELALRPHAALVALAPRGGGPTLLLLDGGVAHLEQLQPLQILLLLVADALLEKTLLLELVFSLLALRVLHAALQALDLVLELRHLQETRVVSMSWLRRKVHLHSSAAA